MKTEKERERERDNFLLPFSGKTLRRSAISFLNAKEVLFSLQLLLRDFRFTNQLQLQQLLLFLLVFLPAFFVPPLPQHLASIWHHFDAHCEGEQGKRKTETAE